MTSLPKWLNIVGIACIISFGASANDLSDRNKITQAALDYIESQHNVDKDQMARGLDPLLVKRTYWKSKSGKPEVMQTSFDTMLWVAENYNISGDKFPEKPKKQIQILDIDNRVASVKLTADDWIDYMHLYKNEEGKWKIINVLWQYHDESRHRSN